MSPTEKCHVFRNLAKYVRTGMGIEKACESMLSQTGVKQAERDIYAAIKHGVHNGQSIAEAMSASSRLNKLDFEMLSASEKGGHLDSGLNHLAEYYERVDRTRKRIRGGLIYPIILFHLGLIVTTLAGAIFSRISIDGPPKPFGEAAWEQGRWAIIIYLIFLAVIFLLFQLRKQARTSAAASRWFKKIPLLGKANHLAALERFSAVFQIFLLSGQKIDASLRSSGEASHHGLIRQSSETGAQKIKTGEQLGDIMMQNPAAFPNDFARGVATAEESGSLDIEFGRWKQYYAESLTDAMDKVAVWVPKLIYFFALFMVAFMIIKAGLSYYGMIEGILNGI